MKRFLFTLSILVVLVAMMPHDGQTIPAFARKYGFNCNMCHTSFVKLNDFGQRFRNNGYQIPGQEGGEKNVFEIGTPLSIRTSAGIALNKQEKHFTSGFNLYGFDLLAAGVMHKNISFLMIYTPRIDEPAADYSGPGGGNNPSQLATLESANIVFSNLVQDALNVRVGRFEPAYHLISSKRSYYMMSPYEVYGYATPNNGFIFDDNQMGVEATGHLQNGFRYAAGLVNGNGANPDNNKFKDGYFALQQIFGRGEGQSAGQQVGIFGYLGWQPTDMNDVYVSPTGEATGHNSKSFSRIGANFSINYTTFNLRALYLHGADNKAFNTDTTQDYKYNGGFAELDYAGLMNNRLLLSAMYNWVSPPSYDENNKIQAFSLLVRYYLGDWTAVNVALHGEYTHRKTGDANAVKDDNFLFLIDFDF
ncbi:conserved exported hypothetical protein [Candidatus Zixiibacteriota bacterium]|nr:conserved exported hypothetical protein [candidate division Zixibacteria bacterium]